MNRTRAAAVRATANVGVTTRSGRKRKATDQHVVEYESEASEPSEEDPLKAPAPAAPRSNASSAKELKKEQEDGSSEESSQSAAVDYLIQHQNDPPDDSEAAMFERLSASPVGRFASKTLGGDAELKMWYDLLLAARPVVGLRETKRKALSRSAAARKTARR
ncbi:Hypothetical protein UVM_LOCUS151 [uncultured virus]|nr:Hypothetical protein UVM_LOCUS151 [uncultured virus]